MATITSLAVLERIHPNVLMIGAKAMASILGVSYKSVNNAGDKWPIRSVKVGRKKYYRLVDIAAYVDGDNVIDSDRAMVGEVQPPLAKRGRGRPPKVKSLVVGRGSHDD